VSAAAIVLLLAVLDDVGSIVGDRIEHASVVPRDCIPRLRAHGIVIVTQPGFIADRGDDYLREVDRQDLPGLYRCKSLVDASIPVAFSSDAPYGPLDPWVVIAAAVRRQAMSGRIVGPEERIAAAAALCAYLTPTHRPGGRPQRLKVGVPADLVLLRAPIQDVLAKPSADAVRRTYIDGLRVY
jgi:predicted amidohydrolase YtcJ